MMTDALINVIDTEFRDSKFYPNFFDTSLYVCIKYGPKLVPNAWFLEIGKAEIQHFLRFMAVWVTTVR